MTDITEQDRRAARKWAENWRGDLDNDTSAAARVILATVDAPPPTLAEELRQWADKTFIEPGYRAILDEIIQRAEQIEEERDQALESVEGLRGEVRGWNEAWNRFTAERDTRPATTIPDPADVPEGQAWVVSIDDMEETAGFKASGFGWICYRELGGTTKAIPSDRITLVSRLVPAPRVITNPDELDTLADGSVVHTRNGDLWKKDSDGMWTYLRPEDAITQRLGPVTVLWEAEVAS